jgi:hypothetical protein
MNNYKRILILHALDDSTSFLSVFGEEFREFYCAFDASKESIIKAKNLLGNLESKSLVIFLGHGSSLGLYEPNCSSTHLKYFLDTSFGNHFFEEHDIFLLSCKSNEYIKKIRTSNFSIGFGNIISSKLELDLHNRNNNFVKLPLTEGDITRFNKIYVDSSLKVVRKILHNEICFFDIPKYLRFLINQEINQTLLDKDDLNRVHKARLLYMFRNEFLFRKNPQS